MLLIWVCLSCSHFHNDDDIGITINDSKNYYKMSAYFSKNQTGKVHRYMDEKLGRHNNISFVNAEMDATITLDDKTTFYIKSFPGDLEIKLDKEKNSVESYMQVKEMCEGIKKVLATN